MRANDYGKIQIIFSLKKILIFYLYIEKSIKVCDHQVKWAACLTNICKDDSCLLFIDMSCFHAIYPHGNDTFYDMAVKVDCGCWMFYLHVDVQMVGEDFCSKLSVILRILLFALFCSLANLYFKM